MKAGWIGKVLALGAVLGVLLTALAMVGGVVNEREGRLREAQRGVATSLAASQWLVGPVLQRNCTESWEHVEGEGKTRKTSSEKREFMLLSAPQSLAVQGHAAMEPRSRGIYTVNTYVLQASVAARWSDQEALQPKREHVGSSVQCAAPQVWLAVGDARGIRKAQVRAQGKELDVQAGPSHPAFTQGLHADLPSAADAALQIDMVLELAGTDEIGIAPVGASNDVKLTSQWPHPSFTGRFLPVQRSVNAAGFEASWQVNALASTAHRDVLAAAVACPTGAAAPDLPRGTSCIDTLGVRFVEPVDVYVLSDRATKYGLLFIVLTLVAVGLTEVLRALRVHPVQYLLVGSALVVFFLLLVSLSEHVPFAWAYSVAAAACTALLAFYGTYVLRGWRAGMVFGGAIAALYGVLYVLLQLEQSALLLGSVMLFGALAIVMAATRRLDWYALGPSLLPAMASDLPATASPAQAR